METKHTQTPWEFGLGLVSVKQIAMFFGPPLLHPTSRHVGQVFGGDSPQSHANADFIVKAVNAHDELIKDIRYIKDLANAHDAKCLNSDTFNAVRIIALCNEALSKAGDK